MYIHRAERIKQNVIKNKIIAMNVAYLCDNYC